MCRLAFRPGQHNLPNTSATAVWYAEAAHGVCCVVTAVLSPRQDHMWIAQCWALRTLSVQQQYTFPGQQERSLRTRHFLPEPWLQHDTPPDAAPCTTTLHTRWHACSARHPTRAGVPHSRHSTCAESSHPQHAPSGLCYHHSCSLRLECPARRLNRLLHCRELQQRRRRRSASSSA